MVRKIIFSFLVIFILWTILFMTIPFKGLPQNQGQDNLMKAQRFIYDDYTATSVIIGTSLSCRIITDSLDQFYNLSFGGLSSSDGLYILNKQEHCPANVFIETNLILKEENPDFLEGLYYGPSYYSKKYLIVLREYNQPATFFVAQMSNEANRLRKNKNQSLDIVSPEIFDNGMEIQIKSYAQIPEEKQIEERFQKLKEQVVQLQSKEVNVVFFELPVNGKLIDMPLAYTIRHALDRYFPKTEYNYLPLPEDCRDYISSDGVHLGKKEALKYTLYFKEKAEKIVMN